MTAPTIDTDPNFVASDACWFRAWREPGAIMVYRAKMFDDRYQSFNPVRKLIKGIEPVVISTQEDRSLMGWEGTLTAYYL